MEDVSVDQHTILSESSCFSTSFYFPDAAHLRLFCASEAKFSTLIGAHHDRLHKRNAEPPICGEAQRIQSFVADWTHLMRLERRLIIVAIRCWETRAILVICYYFYFLVSGIVKLRTFSVCSGIQDQLCDPHSCASHLYTFFSSLLLFLPFWRSKRV